MTYDSRDTAELLSKVEYLSTTILASYKQNAKLHPQKQIQQIANSIRQFGFVNPVIIDDDSTIIAGHGRVEAAKLLKLKKAPVLRLSHLTEEEVRAYRLADNQLTLNSGYDNSLLRIELVELSLLELDFDLEITGFETAQIDLIIDGDVEQVDPDDELPDIDESLPAITKLGDVWQLGNHRLICGDSTKPETYETLMEGEKAQAVVTDPPWNVAIDGHVCGLGKVKHREFAMASGEMSEDEFIAFLVAFIKLCITWSKDGSLHYIFMDWRHIWELISAGRSHYSELKNLCCWNKSNGGMGSLYRSKHELVAVFKAGSKPHINNVELGKYGRYRTNVWDYDGANSFGKGQEDLKLHPTVKPVAMIMDAIKDCTRRGHIVLDPFAGSGSTLIACEKSGRIARCIELDSLYCDVIVRRWQALTGKDAVHVASGKTFNTIANEQEATHDA